MTPEKFEKFECSIKTRQPQDQQEDRRLLEQAEWFLRQAVIIHFMQVLTGKSRVQALDFIEEYPHGNYAVLIEGQQNIRVNFLLLLKYGKDFIQLIKGRMRYIFTEYYKVNS